MQGWAVLWPSTPSGTPQPSLGLSSYLGFPCSEDAMEYSKEFVTAVVLGKDLVPRQVSFLLLWPCRLALPQSLGPGLSRSASQLPGDPGSPPLPLLGLW